MSDEPWYSDGLRFRCTQCGNCCTGAPGVVWVDDEELARIAAHMGQSVGEVRLLHTRLVGNRVSLREHANGDCTFFNPSTRRCTIYAVRPRQCRSWPFWTSHLSSPQAWQDVCDVCPGAGRGGFVGVEEIESLTGLIDI